MPQKGPGSHPDFLTFCVNVTIIVSDNDEDNVVVFFILKFRLTLRVSHCFCPVTVRKGVLVTSLPIYKLGLPFDFH